MKGKAPKTGKMHNPAYAGGNSKVAAESTKGTSGFKKGGKVLSEAASGTKPKMRGDRMPRKSGGGVFSSASSGSGRVKSGGC